MMDWQAAYIQLLLADTAIIAAIGDQLYWAERPTGTQGGNVTLTVIRDGGEQHLKGFSGLQPVRLQIDARAASYGGACALMGLFLGAAVPAMSGHGHGFSRADIEIPPRDLTEQIGEQQETRIYRVSCDISFWRRITA